MRIAIIGASGRTGQAFTTTALESGHQVRAGIRGPSPFLAHDNLAVMTCDATILQDVERLIRDQDVVVSLLGHVKGSDKDVQTRATEQILSAMESEQVDRLISLTGTGVRLPGDKVTLSDKLINFGVRLFNKARVEDGLAHAELIKSSPTKWTVIRVLKLSNGNPKQFTLTSHGPTKIHTPRQEAAIAILDLLENSGFIGQMPIISKAK